MLNPSPWRQMANQYSSFQNRKPDTIILFQIEFNQSVRGWSKAAITFAFLFWVGTAVWNGKPKGRILARHYPGFIWGRQDKIPTCQAFRKCTASCHVVGGHTHTHTHVCARAPRVKQDCQLEQSVGRKNIPVFGRAFSEMYNQIFTQVLTFLVFLGNFFAPIRMFFGKGSRVTNTGITYASEYRITLTMSATILPRNRWSPADQVCGWVCNWFSSHGVLKQVWVQFIARNIDRPASLRIE